MAEQTQSSLNNDETDADRKRSILNESALSLDMVSAFSGDRLLSDHEMTHLNQLKINRGLRFYSDLFYAITHQFFPPETAVQLWNDVQQHKMRLSTSLGRNVRITVATLDYLSNITTNLISTTLVGESYIEELIGLSLRDGLTGLFNRTFFAEQIELEIKRSQRYQLPISLAFIDIDNFKQVNDTWGHQEGDRVLSLMGQLLLNTARDADICCRYGGEEFVVIQPLTDRSDATIITKRIQEKLSVRLPNNQMVTVSVGMASLDKKNLTSLNLIEKADTALYQAKKYGRNRLEIMD